MMEVYCGNLILTDADSQLSPATIIVENGKILKVIQGTKEVSDELKAKASKIIDVGNYVLMPGLVDSHVHVNEPGRTHWEGWFILCQASNLRATSI